MGEVWFKWVGWGYFWVHKMCFTKLSQSTSREVWDLKGSGDGIFVGSQTLFSISLN